MSLVGRAHSRNSRRPRIQNILDWAWRTRIASLKLLQMAPFMPSGCALRIPVCGSKMRSGMCSCWQRRSAFSRRSGSARNHVVQIGTHAGLYVAKPVAAQMFAAIPPCHNNQMVEQPFAFQHSDDDHPRAGFAIVALERAAVRQQDRPCVMGGLGIGFVAFEVF